MWVGGKGRERERERETDRETDRQTDRQTDRKRVGESGRGGRSGVKILKLTGT